MKQEKKKDICCVFVLIGMSARCIENFGISSHVHYVIVHALVLVCLCLCSVYIFPFFSFKFIPLGDQFLFIATRSTTRARTTSTQWLLCDAIYPFSARKKRERIFCFFFRLARRTSSAPFTAHSPPSVFRFWWNLILYNREISTNTHAMAQSRNDANKHRHTSDPAERHQRKQLKKKKKTATSLHIGLCCWCCLFALCFRKYNHFSWWLLAARLHRLCVCVLFLFIFFRCFRFSFLASSTYRRPAVVSSHTLQTARFALNWIQLTAEPSCVSDV